jgi:signal transduction histidine kinase
MTIRTRLVLWYAGILLVGLLFIACWAYYEMVVEHPGIGRVLEEQGHTPLEEFGEVLLFGGTPALLLALVGGWFLMRRALAPVTVLTRAVEQIHADTLREQLPRTGNGDELDRLTEVFNAMTRRLDDSFTRVREFTLHASHELKTPLTILRGEIETKLRDSATARADRDFFADQLDEIARLAKIVDALTLLAKADAGQLPLSREPVRLDELVHDSFTDAQLLAAPRRILVELSACDKTTIIGDRHRLKQLLLNLADNAIKYSPIEGQVTFALSRNNGTAELVLTNTGPGIPPDKLPRVFDRFFRGDPAHNTAVEGCGLGLSIAQRIVSAHGGTIQLVSVPQEITKVTVTLPAQSVS